MFSKKVHVVVFNFEGSWFPAFITYIRCQGNVKNMEYL